MRVARGITWSSVLWPRISGHWRTKAPHHVCFCCRFPLLSSRGLCLGTREASWDMFTSSSIIWRKSTCERKGLWVFKHHLPSPPHLPLRNFLLSCPLCGLYWSVQSTDCRRRAPPSQLPPGPEADLAIACLESLSLVLVRVTHKVQLFSCNSGSSSGAAFLVFGEEMRRAPCFPYTFLLPANTVDRYPPHLYLYFWKQTTLDLSSC